MSKSGRSEEKRHESPTGLKRPHIKIENEMDADKSSNASKEQAALIPETDAFVKKSKDASDNRNFPENWEETLENLREMRKNYNAPVDTMGCDMCVDETATPKDKRYQALLSLMLSSQTKDHITFAAMQNLIKHGCDADTILEMSDEKLGQLIYPVGFWKKKVKYIKESTKMIKEDYNGDIPGTVQDLCKLKGVGPKMAHLCMKTAWGIVTGIGVDTHVHRISNRIGWVKSSTAEQTRAQLEGWLPQALWKEVNHLLVGFGQVKCFPVKPQCATCLNRNICPFGMKQLRSAKK